jgi:diguanylate cyclase (GGDEF)-like protein
MTGKLCILCCRNYYPELRAAVAAERWPDVTVAAFPANCGHPPITWEELRPLVEDNCAEVAILGRACLGGLGSPPADWPPVRELPQEECFDLVAGATLVAEAIARDAYLITPGWLEDWRGKLDKMGFRGDDAAGFFHDFARELVLLDTGVVADAPRMLAELATAVGLPATRVAVGIDYVRQLLARLVAEWHLRQAQQEARERERDHGREMADHKAAMDFLGRLPVLKDEQETIAAIEEMFHMLFAPQELHYVRFEAGVAHHDPALPAELAVQVQALHGDWAWTDSQTGFLLRIARAGEALGVVAVDRFAFPEYRSHYLNLALSVAGVAGLAIDNARTYQRIKEGEVALRKSERSLKMAQAMAHLGHWELDVSTGDIRWSDETYRILGYQPENHAPSYDTFCQAIHPEDRARVASHIAAARDGASFDIEFRIILPDQRVRAIHGMGELMLLGAQAQPQIIGTLVDVTAPEEAELLGVIQDITDHKELQRKLEQEAHTDALTGCANRRYFLELAEHEVARARRYSKQISVLMLDLDHFKDINDRHGHPVGDLVLQRLVQIGRATLRAEDTLGRLGGEEFAILLPETGSQKALEVAERLCRAVAATEVPVPGKPALRFTASIGVATLAPDDFSIGAVLGRADLALYEAKSAGRNRVVAT